MTLKRNFANWLTTNNMVVVDPHHVGILRILLPWDYLHDGKEQLTEVSRLRMANVKVIVRRYCNHERLEGPPSQ